MLSLAEVVALRTELSAADLADLERLVEEWELLADLSFSDLILWVPDADPNVFWAAAQVRPTTGPTALEDDVVGDDISYEVDSLVMEAYLSQELAHTSGNKLHAGIPVEQHAVPISRRGRVIGIVEMHTNRMGVRAPGALEETYLDLATILRAMMFRGEFPMDGEKPVPWISPRVVDGLIRVDGAGNVIFASPNSVSAFRRLGVPGDLLGEEFRHVLATLPAETRMPTDTAVSDRVRPHEFDLDSTTAAVRLRVQPLLCAGRPCGYLIMCRDTTELRSRERQLVTKDATIREIHHRVKNNLQTVSALLRLQARRTASDETRNALSDAQKRVAAIAVVHEILSQAFDSSVRFDDVADRLLMMVREVAAMHHVIMRREGSFGYVPAAAATSLSLVLTEITQNAIEHGLGEGAGTVTVRAAQNDGRLVVEVINDGTSMPTSFRLEDSDSLGLSIVATLVADLHGRFEVLPREDAPGTRAVIDIPVA
ncbi:sensor histidine kinase [Propioniciclava tarda]|uniref:histidine kinase n=1 Tax=Propioniciclava tarda TaxID=433330 RepID=A0A4Q9KN20_PROTD|nr:PAS domain-containing sensor histidine kinase [Propioniciclava tarda]TBT95169.1 ATPase [Propioniciclava tarda]SMO51520.1 Two-component sensor histidine kinase, contains HisKA and HATPase domains [Propioniciclava tarda]HOA88988.1 histidine kinase N-terminal domain-containing protein [Propioniciclava tarda]HQA30228.1 histidine kinase N-terminal domain-containing protein [Propioniciclava tarda]HQD61487.1 histidine kinase N-terminal domain-containing protein [Propioniciclava tarda]